MSKRVYIGSDHNGNAARNYVLKVLNSIPEISGVWDMGLESGKVDYPTMAQSVCDALTSRLHVSPDAESYGILICGTGTGMCIAANKQKDIRAGIATDRATAELMREHNDCNVLCLGGRVIGPSLAADIIKAYLAAEFTGDDRHKRRLAKIDGIEREFLRDDL